MSYNLVNCNFNRHYNPSGQQNALSDVKRLLTSRDTVSQNRACGYLVQAINRYANKSEEGWRMIDYLLDNDITVFLCEATSNLDFSLFKSIASCLRSLWRSSRFFSEEHAAHSSSAVLRALAYYAASGPPVAVEYCLHFLYDLLSGISTNKTTSPLSHQSAYSADQLLSCLNSLIPQIGSNPYTIMSSALVLQAVVSYQPENLYIKDCTAKSLAETLGKWLELLVNALNHSMLVGNESSGMIYVLLCHLSIDTLRLIKLLNHGNQKVDFVNTILADSQEVDSCKEYAADMTNSVIRVMSELVQFTKDHQSQMTSKEYGIFLKFLLNFFHEMKTGEVLPDFCETLFTQGYLKMLPQAQIDRKDAAISKSSTLIIGEMLKVLADKYLNVNDSNSEACLKDINMGLVELQYGIEKPQYIMTQLQKGQPYSLLIYMYFYCQCTENPEETMAPLLPFVVEHILKLPKSFKPPPHIIKALWLVFAMCIVSNRSAGCMEQRVRVERASDRLARLLRPDPAVLYTHNPAILLWTYTSIRIPHFIRILVLVQWLKHETSIPLELTVEPGVWELLLTVIVQFKDKTVVDNCMECLQDCIEGSEGSVKEAFTTRVWSVLPDVLAEALVHDEIDANITYILDLATTLLPTQIDSTICSKTSVLIAIIFSKHSADFKGTPEDNYRLQNSCLKLSLYLLNLASSQNDNTVLATYVNRAGFLPSVLSTADSADETSASAALQLLAYVVHYHAKNNYKPKSVIQIQMRHIIQTLRKDSNSPRTVSLLQLIYKMLNAGVHSPFTLVHEIREMPVEERQYNALRALMLRIQLMLCCRGSENQLLMGWKTLSSIFKHAIISKNDTKMISCLTSQPWTMVLVQFQIGENITTDFLTFLLNWLVLLNITVKNDLEVCRRKLRRNSLVIKTMVALKKNLIVREENKELVEQSGAIVKEILDISGVKM